MLIKSNNIKMLLYYLNQYQNFLLQFKKNKMKNLQLLSDSIDFIMSLTLSFFPLFLLISSSLENCDLKKNILICPTILLLRSLSKLLFMDPTILPVKKLV